MYQILYQWPLLQVGIIYISIELQAWISYYIYRKLSNIRRTKYQNLNASRLIL